MANIDQYIEQIENARYGNEVRQAIVDALTAMNAEISSSGVTSFNERVGNVVSADGDYNISQISATGGMQGQVPVVNSNGGFTMRDMTGEVVALNQLTDVNVSSPSDGQVLKYDALRDEWINGGGPSEAMSDLEDVTISSPSNYDMLRYYGSTQKWQNVAGMTTRVGSADATDGRHDAMRITSSNVLNLCGMPATVANGTYTILPFACTEMPMATDYLVGTMVLYLGTTSASYTQGNVYKCIKNNDTYEWQQVCDLLSTISSYSDLSNKPQINGNTLTGNKTSANLGLLDEDFIDVKNNWTLAKVTTADSWYKLPNVTITMTGNAITIMNIAMGDTNYNASVTGIAIDTIDSNSLSAYAIANEGTRVNSLTFINRETSSSGDTYYVKIKSSSTTVTHHININRVIIHTT